MEDKRQYKVDQEVRIAQLIPGFETDTVRKWFEERTALVIREDNGRNNRLGWGYVVYPKDDSTKSITVFEGEIEPINTELEAIQRESTSF